MSWKDLTEKVGFLQYISKKHLLGKILALDSVTSDEGSQLPCTWEFRTHHPTHMGSQGGHSTIKLLLLGHMARWPQRAPQEKEGTPRRVQDANTLVGAQANSHSEYWQCDCGLA